MKINKEGAFKILLDIIIPPDNTSGLDGGSSINLQLALGDDEYLAMLNNFIKILEQTSKESNVASPELLSEQNLVSLIHKAKLKNFRFFNHIASILSEFYYLNKDNRKALNLKTLPPFPEGNIIQDIDLTILEPVFNKGKIYREL